MLSDFGEDLTIVFLQIHYAKKIEKSTMASASVLYLEIFKDI